MPENKADNKADNKAVPVEVSPGKSIQVWLVRGGQVIAGILVALLIAELVFRQRDDGAFPHVNFYQPDDELGVRLQANSSQKISFGGNPVTSIRTNSAGYRGGNWGDATGDEILVVGDSQVFGLGVQEDETFASQLSELTGRPVINGGVPTYGPAEYAAVVREMLAKRKLKTVVYTVNFVNDLFELDKPNLDRHKVWDGWAVRSETAPSSRTWFPARGWLMSKSHAVYALRRWLYERGPKVDDDGFDSEGTWRDVVSIDSDSKTEKARRSERAAGEDAKRLARLAALEEELEAKRKEVADKLARALPQSDPGRLQASASSPGDIVARLTAPNAEASRNIVVTADHIQRGVAYRNELAKNLNPEIASHRAAADSIKAETSLAATRAALAQKSRAETYVPSVLAGEIEAVKAVTDAAGAELVVVALPIDVQVSSEQWKKYGVENPVDMIATRVLLGDLVESAQRLGARGVDVTAALAGVSEPFLDKDIHMTASGHRAVAESIAERLAGPPALPRPRPGLPRDRSRIPSRSEWITSPEITVKGSSALACETFAIREWFRMSCTWGGYRPSGIEVKKGGHGEELITVTEYGALLLMPIVAGDEVEVTVVWEQQSLALTGTRKSADSPPSLSFSTEKGPGRPLVVSDADALACRCHNELYRESRCSEMIGAPTAACIATYSDDCEALLACGRGDPLTLPPCPEGYANAGGSGQCFQLCSSEVSCSEGSCTPWQGTNVCL